MTDVRALGRPFLSVVQACARPCTPASTARPGAPWRLVTSGKRAGVAPLAEKRATRALDTPAPVASATLPSRKRSGQATAWHSDGKRGSWQQSRPVLACAVHSKQCNSGPPPASKEQAPPAQYSCFEQTFHSLHAMHIPSTLSVGRIG